MIKLLLVDDHDLFRNGLRSLLEDESDIIVVGEAASGEQALDFCRGQRVDIVLMDMRMPGMGGMEATRRITRVVDGARLIEDTRVIALTASKNETISSQFLKAGAAGFISKDARFTDLLHAIRSVNTGSPYLCGDLARRMALMSTQAGCSPFESLTSREFQICQMIVECRKAPAIAALLHLSTKTINTYRYRIFEKLKVSGDVELTHLALRFGLIELAVAASR